MKNIELTEDHKSKLLEMCKELFPEPEFSFWWEYEMYGRGLKQDFNDVLCVSETLNPPINVGTEEKPYFRTNNYFNIHWFEFCTKIGHKIFSRKQFYYQSEEFITFMKIMCLQDKSKLKHPIDYLYEEFKKLK